MTLTKLKSVTLAALLLGLFVGGGGMATWSMAPAPLEHQAIVDNQARNAGPNAQPADVPQPKPAITDRPDDEFEGIGELKTLIERWRGRQKESQEAFEKEPSPEKRKAFVLSLWPNDDPKAIDEFFQLEKKYRGKTIGMFSLHFVMNNAGGFGDPDLPVSRLRERAFDVMREHYLHHPDLDYMFLFLRNEAMVVDGERLLEAAAAKSPHDRVRAAALYWHADQLVRKAQFKALIDRQPKADGKPKSEPLSEVAKRKQEVIAERANFDVALVRQQAATLAKRIIAEYPDAVRPWLGSVGIDSVTLLPERTRTEPAPFEEPQKFRTYADRARSLLFELTQLVVGESSPMLEAKDMDGKEFRLSDDKGKVVVLLFSDSEFTKKIYPSLRELQKKFEGKSLSIVSVITGTEEATVRNAIANGEIAWRAIWDSKGEELDSRGLIASKWNIQTFPVIYVFDRRGIIHSRWQQWVSQGGLESQVAELLKEEKK